MNGFDDQFERWERDFDKQFEKTTRRAVGLVIATWVIGIVLSFASLIGAAWVIYAVVEWLGRH